jgi:hypothetical protein
MRTSLTSLFKKKNKLVESDIGLSEQEERKKKTMLLRKESGSGVKYQKDKKPPSQHPYLANSVRNKPLKKEEIQKPFRKASCVLKK